MLNLYDLLADPRDADRVLAWSRGEDVPGLPRLTPAEVAALADSWQFGARPGQAWTPGVEFITDFEAGRGFGKALSLDTPLPTPYGWTTMGQVAEGDSLLDEQGRPCTVTGVHEVDAREAWRLTFSDKTHVDACGDHLWVTLDILERKRLCRRSSAMMPLWAYSPARTTREVVKTLKAGSRGDTNHCIPLAAPLALTDVVLPLDPYVLGVWLGDGTTSASHITSHVDDAPHYEARFTKGGLSWRCARVDARNPNVGTYHFGDKGEGITILRGMGVLGNKHIPPAYLRASYPQRLALMQGLIDTDGTVDKENGGVEFCSMLEHLAEQVEELARTLGQKPVTYTGRATLNGKDYGTKYRVCWRPTLQMASLPRKVVNVHTLGSQAMRTNHRMIVDASSLPPQRMRCVTVDSPAHMYLCGRGMIPTHNTTVGSEAICDAANDPEKWGGYAAVVGPDPTEVLRDPLFGKAGIFACAARRERSGLGPGIRSRNLNQRIMQFEAPTGGGGGGLTVHWAASSDPKSVHGMNVGLAWLEEFGVWYHDKLDEQSNNAWRALQPAIRLGLSKVIVTQTPSRAAEVRTLQRDAERPECPTCRAVDAAKGKHRWRGEVGREPWRLSRSEQVRIHPLLNTRTTIPSRACPVCGGLVVAQVRCVFGDTTDNPTLSAGSLARAAAEVASGTVAGRQSFAPRGEVDSGSTGQLVQEDHVRKHVALPVPDEDRRTGPVADRWMLALGQLGAGEVVVQVDPAVTATASADETGVVAACDRVLRGGEHDGGEAGAGQTQVVGLEDASVHPAEVEDGAPSTVWAPRAYRLACLWGARRIVVEVNQGGDEVLSAVRDLVARPPTEAQWQTVLAEMFPGVAPARLGQLARRVAGSARAVRVESVTRQSDKQTRLEWYGRTASLGRQAVLVADWLPDGARHWSAAMAQVTGYEPPRQDGPRVKPRKDRGDALVAAAQVLLGVRETAREGIVDPREMSWLGKVRAPRAGG